MNQSHQDIRNTQLLKDEKIWTVLHPSRGLLEEAPDQGDCLVLTNQRVLGYWQEQGRNRQILLPLEAVEAVELSSTERSIKPLMQGAFLLLASVVVIWLALAFNAMGVLSWLIVATMVLLAAVTASAYFANEQTALITFRAGTSEATLHLHTAQAKKDAQGLALGFFQARAGQEKAPSAVPPVEAPAPWSGIPQDGPLESGQGGDSGNADTVISPVESTQAEGRHDI